MPWRYSSTRLLRNAVALAVTARSEARDRNGNELSSTALESARLWEALGRLGQHSTKVNALANAATLYEIAGYQANAATLARELLPPARNRQTRLLEEYVALFLQRRYIALRLEPDTNLDESLGEDEFTRQMTRVGALRGMQAAASYFMSGSSGAYESAIKLLDASIAASAEIGDVGETNLVRGIRSVLPVMYSRSTWQTLVDSVEHPRWRRYLRILGRGLSQPMVYSRSVSELWPSQAAAITGGLLSSHDNLVIRTPTSSGKTRIAELAIVQQLLAEGEARALYVAPYRALVNEVGESFSACFTDLGLSAASLAGTFEQDDGQVVLSNQARVLVLTPEKLDLLSRLSPELIKTVRLVVLDEGQIVGEGDRGRRYDLLVSRLRTLLPDARFLFLSAVVPDQTLLDFAAWLGSDRAAVRSGWRPAILRAAALQWRGGDGRLEFEAGEGLDEALNEFSPVVIKEATFEYVDARTQRVRRPRFPTDNRGQVAAALAYELVDGGPVLISTTMPAWAVSTAEALLDRVVLGQAVGEATKPSFASVSDRRNPPLAYAAAVEWLGEDHRVTRLLSRGIAVHHGPLPDPIRTAIEDDFRNRRLDVLVATSTLAQGVNLPVRTVIMHSCWRADATGGTRISPRDYWNIAGRAGRAGEETSGLVVHLVLNDRDRRDFRYFLSHRISLDPVESALLGVLRDLLNNRISPELVDAAIDPAILAILMEEGVDPDAAVDGLLPNTLCAVQAARQNINIAPLAAAMRATARRIVTEVPAGTARRVFASTGLSSKSCEQLRLHIPETADQSGFPGDYDQPVRLWLQGMTVSGVAATLDVTTDRMSELIEEFVAYKLPWGVTALWRIAQLELGLEGLSDVAESLPAMLKYGVPTPEATWAHAAGVSSRTLATLLGERFGAEGSDQTADSFATWLATQQVETLADEYGVSGQALREVASAVLRSRPNRLIDELDLGTLLPRTVAVRLLRSVPPASLGRLLANSDPIHLVRDYDSALSRNSILVAAGSRRLAYLPWDLAVALAPEIDGGRAVLAVALGTSEGEKGPELIVRLRWQRTAGDAAAEGHDGQTPAFTLR